MVHPIWLGGKWEPASASGGTFSGANPKTGETLSEVYPVSTWNECDRALANAATAFRQLLETPRNEIAEFLRTYADRLESNAQQLAETAAMETGLPMSPRLKDVELPRTTNQLRQAADAAADGGWALPTIDSKNNIRSQHGAIGPVIVFGPNNFPFAYNSIAGGDFASAIAAGNPVIAKAHPAHPTTTRLMAELCAQALAQTKLPAGTVQLLYHMSQADGLRMVADERAAAVGFTGSRRAGLALKAACDAAGKPSYLEMSSVNPVVILPGAIAERTDDIVDKFCTSCLMATGQFCTNPGLVILIAGPETDGFVAKVATKFREAPAGVLLTEGVLNSLFENVQQLVKSGAQAMVGGKRTNGPGFSFENTLLSVSGGRFLEDPLAFQTEMFGNASLFVLARDVDQVTKIIEHLEGNLTGTIFSAASNRSDETAYQRIAPALRKKVGRLNDDKMPTGVLVTAAMNHGGPYPSTGHAGFTAVGFPACVRRFSMLECFDGVREEHLPETLRNQNPTGVLWRFVDGTWTQGNV